MNSEKTDAQAPSIRWQLIFLAFLLLPVIVLLLVPTRTPFVWLVVWFLALLIFNLFIIWLIARGRSSAKESQPPVIESGPRMLNPEDFPVVVREAMDIRIAIEENGARVFRGNLRQSPQETFGKLKDSFGADWLPLLQQDPQMEAAILLLPKPAEFRTEKPVRLWVHWLLFALTFITTTCAGALYQGVNLFQTPGQFAVGLPYSIGLLAILGLHELGHYFTARHYKMRVTPPYFIPVPFALGTFGAFIAMRSPAEDRRSLFDVAVAGPFAGLILAIPALIIGLQTSTVIPASPESQEMLMGGGAIGSSILFALIAKVALGTKIASGYLLHLSPLAFAGWLGLLVTALNLLPIGQLDGGHIAQAMFGSRGGGLISRVSMWALIVLAVFVWPSLLFFALIVFFIARRGSPPLNDLTPVSPGRLWLGGLSFIILALILIPMPSAFWAAIN